MFEVSEKLRATSEVQCWKWLYWPVSQVQRT